MNQAIELKDFLSYRYLSGLRYAPDGKRAAFALSVANEEENRYESRLWMWEDGALRQLTDLGSERSFFWEDATHLLFPAVRTPAEKKRAEGKDSFTSYYRLDVTGGEALHAFTLPFAAGKLLHLSGTLYAVSAAIDANEPDFYKLEGDARADSLKRRAEDADYEVLDELPFWSNGEGMVNKQRNALFLADIATGAVRRVTEPTFSMDSFELFGGKLYLTGAAYTDKMPLDSDLYVLDFSAEDALPVKLTACAPCMFYSLIATKSRLLCLATEGKRHGLNENAGIWQIDPESGARTLLCEPRMGLGNSVGSDCRLGGGESFQAVGEDLYFTLTREGDCVLERFTKENELLPLGTPAGSADCIAFCDGAEKLLLIGLYEMRLQELYACDVRSGALMQISHFNDAILADKYVARPEPMQMESCGLSIGGWVLKPKDYDPARRYPAVLDIHGGPKTVYGPVFYHEMQVWASLGYFVFFANPKGSDGRDDEFADIRGAYGTTDYQNLMDFTDAVLAAFPQIDPARVCVTGGSYGGFMTNWIIGHTDRFVCAASQRSIANWLSFYGVSDIGNIFATDQNNADFFDSAEKMWEHSPVRYAKNAVTPTLFIHSDEDYRCPLAEGLQMFSALRDRGVPARLCLFHGENHELSRSGKPKHRVRRLREITDWFEKYAK